jgi:3-oxoacyl-(acyl-carrier-protein) synthase
MRQNEPKGIFIADAFCISPQRTYDGFFFENGPAIHSGTRYMADEPAYGNLIPPGLLRRMGKAVRMGVGAGLPVINRNAKPDGIVLGTANGGLEDCLKFLNQIVDYEEGTLTPTNFVQSTPNAVAGSLALMSRNTGYNTTHVHQGLAFEAALLDALLLLQGGQAKSLLLGSVEEISDYNYNIDALGGAFKVGENTSENLLFSDTPGTVCGEGATMFLVTAEKDEKSLAEIVDVDQITYADEDLLFQKLQFFLSKNKLKQADIDAVILGYSGDNRTDGLYTHFQKALFPHADRYTFKDLVGDYPTASAFATWLGLQAISGKHIVQHNTDRKKRPDHILIYNHYRGVQHAFILMRAIR